MALQKKFFGHFLKGGDRLGQVLLQVRHVDKFVERPEASPAAQAHQVDQDVPQPSGLLAVESEVQKNFSK